MREIPLQINEERTKLFKKWLSTWNKNRIIFPNFFTYHFFMKELMCVAHSDSEDAVTRTVNVQVSYADGTSFFECCGLSSFHTLIYKVYLHVISALRTFV